MWYERSFSQYYDCCDRAALYEKQKEREQKSRAKKEERERKSRAKEIQKREQESRVKAFRNVRGVIRTTTPIVGKAAGGTVVTTKSGSKYFLDGGDDVIGYEEAQRLKANTPNWQLKRDISAKIMHAEKLHKACQQPSAPLPPPAEDGSLTSSHPVYEKRRISPFVGDELNRARNSPPPAEDRSSKSSHLGTDGPKDVTAPALPSSTSGKGTPKRRTKHRVHPVHEPKRRISASMGDQFGRARYSSNNLEKDFVERSHRSLQSRQMRRVKDGRVKRVDKSYNRNYSSRTIRESSTITSASALSNSGTEVVEEVAAPESYTGTDAVEKVMPPPAVHELTASASDSSISGTELMAMMVHLEKRLKRMEASSRHLMDAVVPALLAAANRSLQMVTPKQRNVQPCVISRPPTLDEEMISDWARNCMLPARYNPLCEEASVFITAAQHAAARSIQRVVRRGLARLSFCRLRNAVILLQTAARGKLAKAKLQRLRTLEEVKAKERFSRRSVKSMKTKLLEWRWKYVICSNWWMPQMSIHTLLFLWEILKDAVNTLLRILSYLRNTKAGWQRKHWTLERHRLNRSQRYQARFPRISPW